MGYTNGYKRTGKFIISNVINSNVGYGRNENVRKLGNSCFGQLKLKGGERKAEKIEKTTEEKKEDEEVRAEKTEKTTWT